MAVVCPTVRCYATLGFGSDIGGHLMGAIVYQAVNLVNGKRYIGITGRALSRRIAQHRWDSKNGKRGKFYNAMRKNGDEMFRFSIIKVCASFKAAAEEERRLIALWKPEYNLTTGGEGTPGHFVSKETARRVAEKNRGRPAHNKGVPHTREARAKMSAAWKSHPDHKPRLGVKRPGSGLKGWLLSVERGTAVISAQKRMKRVRCIDDGIIFDSVKAAAAHYGILRTGISSCCCGHKKTARGKRFEFVVKENGPESSAA